MNCNVTAECSYKEKSKNFHSFTDENKNRFGLGFHKSDSGLRQALQFRFFVLFLFVVIVVIVVGFVNVVMILLFFCLCVCILLLLLAAS